MKKKIYYLCMLLLSGFQWVQSQTIDIDYQNVSYDPATDQICFDIYMRAGVGYPGGAPWTAMNIRMDFDLDVASGSPVFGTGVFSNVNTTYIGGTPGSNPSVPGMPTAPYNYEFGLFFSRGIAPSDLPVNFTRMATVCIPITGGEFVDPDPDDDLQMRGNIGGAPNPGSFWTSTPSGSPLNRPFAPLEAQEPLPLELLAFKPFAIDCELSVYWETASEKNLSHFQIEASKDGRSFAAIGHKKPNAAHSATLQTYKYEIPATYHGYYFRLKALDLDGAYQYSEVVYGETPCHKQYALEVFPNPNYLEQLTVEVYSSDAHEQARWYLLDSFGKRLQEGKIDLQPGANRFPIDTQQLPGGTYLVQFVDIPPLYQPVKFVKARF